MVSKIRESLDTNIILRLALRDVPEQCLLIQDLFMRQGFCYDVADLTVMEAVYVLQGENSREDIVKMLGEILSLPDMNYNRALFEKVLPMYLEHPKLSFNDCCLAVYAELNEAQPLWTFDKALARQPGVQLLNVAGVRREVDV